MNSLYKINVQLEQSANIMGFDNIWDINFLNEYIKDCLNDTTNLKYYYSEEEEGDLDDLVTVMLISRYKELDSYRLKTVESGKFQVSVENLSFYFDDEEIYKYLEYSYSDMEDEDKETCKLILKAHLFLQEKIESCIDFHEETSLDCEDDSLRETLQDA